MGIIAWIVLGLIAGAIAKAIMPGNDPGGFIVTILIGIVGAFLGGFLGNMITGAGLNGFSLWSIVLAIVGSLILLWIYRMTTRTPRDNKLVASVCERQRAATTPFAARFRTSRPLAFDRAHLDPSFMALWLFWLLLGLIAGSLAKFLMPGRDPAGCIFTIVLGIVGSMLGGVIGTRLGWGSVTSGDLDFRSIGIATFGALILLVIGRIARRAK